MQVGVIEWYACKARVDCLAALSEAQFNIPTSGVVPLETLA